MSGCLLVQPWPLLPLYGPFQKYWSDEAIGAFVRRFVALRVSHPPLSSWRVWRVYDGFPDDSSIHSLAHLPRLCHVSPPPVVDGTIGRFMALRSSSNSFCTLLTKTAKRLMLIAWTPYYLCSILKIEIQFQISKPRSTCLYSDASIWPRILSAAAHNWFSNPRFAPLLFLVAKLTSFAC